jgi:hypothetical protein
MLTIQNLLFISREYSDNLVMKSSSKWSRSVSTSFVRVCYRSLSLGYVASKKSGKVMRIVLMVFSCWFSVWTHGAVWAAADVDQDKTWSFRFEKTPIPEVLNQLTEVTGIEIFTDKLPETKSLTRTYNKWALDKIIKDVFRGTNHVIIWHHGERGKESVEIHVFDRSLGSRGTVRDFPAVSRTPRRNPQRSMRGPAVAEKTGRHGATDDPEVKEEDEEEPEEEKEDEEEDLED